MAFLRVGQPHNIEEYANEAHDHGIEYTSRLHFEMVGYGNGSPRTIIRNLQPVNQQERLELFRWGAGRLTHYSVSLNGTMGQMIILHCLNYLDSKYARIEPSEANMIGKIVNGVPFTLSTTRVAKRAVTLQSDYQRYFLQCLADMIELYAAVKHNDNILRQVPEITPPIIFYEPLEDGDAFFKPPPRALRAAYELRLFYQVREMQLDAKRIQDTERDILKQASESDTEEEDSDIEVNGSASENGDSDGGDQGGQESDDGDDTHQDDDSTDEESGMEMDMVEMAMIDLDYDGLAGNAPQILQPEE